MIVSEEDTHGNTQTLQIILSLTSKKSRIVSFGHIHVTSQAAQMFVSFDQQNLFVHLLHFSQLQKIGQVLFDARSPVYQCKCLSMLIYISSNMYIQVQICINLSSNMYQCKYVSMQLLTVYIYIHEMMYQYISVKIYQCKYVLVQITQSKSTYISENFML